MELEGKNDITCYRKSKELDTSFCPFEQIKTAPRYTRIVDEQMFNKDI